MELHWLRSFHAVARAKSITLASRQLRVSQPAVTKIIKQLENHYELKLFVRKRRGMDLTREGQALYERCIPIFQRLDELNHFTWKSGDQFRGLLRVGASDSICNYLFPKKISAFQKNNPEVGWDIFSGTSNEIKKRLIAGELDYGMFFTRIGLQDRQLLEERVLTSLPFAVASSKKLPRFKTIAELNRLDLPYVGARTDDYPTLIPEQWIYGKLGIKVGKTYQANNKETQKRLILEGLGFGVLPTFMIQDSLAKLQIFKSAQTEVSLLLVSRKGETISPGLEAFLRTLKF
jgi:DNA-binding transcriptional LysR family regulator